MSRFIKVGDAAKYLGISIQTLRRWEVEGRIQPDIKSAGGTRYYDKQKLIGKKYKIESDLTLCYARVSSHDQKQDLERQVTRLEDYCIASGWSYEIIQDLGSGLNYRKKGLRRLISLILECEIKRLVITHKDRIFYCTQCELTIDRDLNVAKNLFSTVSFTGYEVSGKESAGFELCV